MYFIKSIKECAFKQFHVLKSIKIDFLTAIKTYYNPIKSTN